MKRFVQLFAELDATTSTNAKIDALQRYFAQAPARDAAWAVYFLSGGKPRQVVNMGLLAQLACREAGIPGWAVRRELPHGGRPGRNHRAGAAAGRARDRPGPDRMGRGAAAAAARHGRGGDRAARDVLVARAATGDGAAPQDEGQPYPFFLAHQLDAPAEVFASRLGPVDDWLVE